MIQINVSQCKVLIKIVVLRCVYVCLCSHWAVWVFSALLKGWGDAVLDRTDPRLLQPFRVRLQQTAPVETHTHTHICASVSEKRSQANSADGQPASRSHVHTMAARSCAPTQTHLDGDTTSKQNRLSFSALGLTVQRRKSSTTTVGWSCMRHGQEERTISSVYAICSAFKR